jgi:signal transduction histidine kinase/ActR/RegA family two-component response regulator
LKRRPNENLVFFGECFPYSGHIRQDVRSTPTSQGAFQVFPPSTFSGHFTKPTTNPAPTTSQCSPIVVTMIKSFSQGDVEGGKVTSVPRGASWPHQDRSGSIDFKADSNQLEELRRQLEESQSQNVEKERRIQCLEKQISEKDALVQNQGLEAKLASYLIGRVGGSGAPPMEFQAPPQPGKQRYSSTNSNLTRICHGAKLRNAEPEKSEKLKTIELWLLDEATKSTDIESLVTEYAEQCLSLGIPLDRLVIFSRPVDLRSPSFLFKWEFGRKFKEKQSNSDEVQGLEGPFRLFVEGQATDYQMKGDIEELPEGCKWFKLECFRDYLALPAYHAGQLAGAVSYCTKAAEGFGQGSIDVFKGSLPGLTALVTCLVKDFIVTSLMDDLEQKICEQTMELAAANSSLAKANERIVQQAKSQIRNFAMMSHEIRTPLNCIIGMSNLLLHSDLDATAREGIEMITSSGDLLLAVVDDVLDYSKLATGIVETRFELTQLALVIRTVVASVQIRATSSGVDLETRIDESLPSGVQTDGRRLQQILYNLLGNAIKFGGDGQRVEFNVELVRRHTLEVVHDSAMRNAPRSDDDLIRFSIKDYGKGVPPSEIEKIFQPFQQAATNDPTVGGTGLGLAITKQLVRVLGGRISVESEYGSWCEFVVLLPVMPDRPIVISVKDGTCTGSTSLLDQHSHHSRKSTVSMPPQNQSFRSMKDNDDCSWSDDDSYSSLSTNTTSKSHRSTSSTRVRKSISHPQNFTLFSSEDGNSIQRYNTVSIDHILPQEIPPEDHETWHQPCDLQSKTLSLDGTRPLPEESSRKTPLFAETPKEVPWRRSLLTLTNSDIQERTVDFDFEPLRILVAEDNKINQKVLNRTLVRMGLRDIDIVDDGKQAVEAFKAKEYDVIFMDLQMPVMDGLEATSIISTQKRARGIEYPKVVFLTAHAMVDYQDKAATAGGDGFVSKPYKFEILKELVLRFMENRQL